MSPAGRSVQSELSCYHPDAPLWFCFVSCNQSVNEVIATCGNTRLPSKGCCHLSRRWSPRCSWRSLSSLQRPSAAQRCRELHQQPCPSQGDVRNMHCSVLNSRGVQALLMGGHKPAGSVPKAGGTSSCCFLPPTSCPVSDAAAPLGVPEMAAVPLSATAQEQPKL